VTGSQRTPSSDHRDSASSPRAGAIPYDLKRAIEYIRESGGRKISVANLVAYCGVAERTLHKHFKAFMGVSPLEYWRRHRLAEAREEFLKGPTGTSVTEVATRLGFGHFGRFSQQYRNCFRETPSSTLRRSRVAERKQIARVGEDQSNAAVAGPSSRERPSIAIVPFQVSPEHRMLGECVAEAIAAALCRVRSLSVALPPSMQGIGSRDPKRLAREFNTRYLLSGSVAQSGERVRITVRLIDASTGFHIWGDSYDGAAGDQFALHDRVNEGVVRALVPRIRGAEIENARRKQPRDLDAYGLTMRAFPFVFATFPRAAKRALESLDRAMEIDPDYAPASALAAWCHAQLVMHNGTPSPGQERAHALRLSERAGILDPDDPLVLAAAGAVHTMAGHLDYAGELVARSLALDPSFVWGWERSAWLKAFRGEPEAAIEDFARATRLDCRPPSGIRLIGIGCAHFDAGRYKQAAFWKRKGLLEQPGTAWINRTLSVSYARLGERSAALNSLLALRRYAADLTISQITAAIPFRQDFLDRVAEGLNDLGLPG
jgi:TolB-like protein/tetratricopeptide (TPR) repeat protein